MSNLYDEIWQGLQLARQQSVKPGMIHMNSDTFNCVQSRHREMFGDTTGKTIVRLYGLSITIDETLSDGQWRIMPKPGLLSALHEALVSAENDYYAALVDLSLSRNAPQRNREALQGIVDETRQKAETAREAYRTYQSQ